MLCHEYGKNCEGVTGLAEVREALIGNIILCQ